MTRQRRRRKTKIAGQFMWRLVEMLESPAFCILNQSEHRILNRLEIELGHHGGTENGRLMVTYQQLESYGVDRQSIAPALRALEALNFIKTTRKGRGGNAEYREAAQYLLTYRETEYADPTNDWRKIKTKEEAAATAKAARSAKDAGAVSRSMQHVKKQKAGVEIPQVSGGKLHPENDDPPGGNLHPSAPGGNLHPTIYISGERQPKKAREARPSGSAVASGPSPRDKPEVLQHRIAQRIGDDGWVRLGELTPPDLATLTAMEAAGTLDAASLETILSAKKENAA